MNNHDLIINRLIISSCPEVWHYASLNKEVNAERCLSAWRAGEGTIFSKENCRSVELDRRVIAICVGIPTSEVEQAWMHGYRIASKFLDSEEMNRLDEYGFWMQHLFPLAFEHNIYHLMNLAVDPDQQGRGYGHKLLTQEILLAKLKGYSKFQLDVSVHNPAINLYLNLGFEILHEIRVPYLESHGIPAHFRMVKPLT